MARILVRPGTGGWQLATLRRVLVRHPSIIRLTVVVLAAGAAWGVDARIEAAERARAAWSSGSPVLVAVRQLHPGEPITASLVRAVDLPAAIVPPTAFTELPGELVAVDQIGVGEVLLAHHTSAGTAPAALLPVGTVGVAVPLSTPGWQPALGDTLIVRRAADELGLDPAAAAAGELTAGALVVAVLDGAVLLAVPEADGQAAAVSEAAASGRATLLLRRVPPLPAG